MKLISNYTYLKNKNKIIVVVISPLFSCSYWTDFEALLMLFQVICILKVIVKMKVNASRMRPLTFHISKTDFKFSTLFL